MVDGNGFAGRDRLLGAVVLIEEARCEVGDGRVVADDSLLDRHSLFRVFCVVGPGWFAGRLTEWHAELSDDVSAKTTFSQSDSLHSRKDAQRARVSTSVLLPTMMISCHTELEVSPQVDRFQHVLWRS